MSFPKIDNLYSNLSTPQAISHRSIGIGTNEFDDNNNNNKTRNNFNNLKNSYTSHNSKANLFSYSKHFPLFSNNLLRNRHELNIESFSFQPLLVRNNIISFNNNKKNNLIAFEDKEMINFFKYQTKSNFNNKYNIIFKTKNDKKKEQIKNCFKKIKDGICINEINLELKNNFIKNNFANNQNFNKNKKINSFNNLNDVNFLNFKNRISSAKKIRIQTLNFFYSKNNKENNKNYKKHFKSNLNNYNFNINKIYSKLNNNENNNVNNNN